MVRSAAASRDPWTISLDAKSCPDALPCSGFVSGALNRNDLCSRSGSKPVLKPCLVLPRQWRPMHCYWTCLSALSGSHRSTMQISDWKRCAVVRLLSVRMDWRARSGPLSRPDRQQPGFSPSTFSPQAELAERVAELDRRERSLAAPRHHRWYAVIEMALAPLASGL